MRKLALYNIEPRLDSLDRLKELHDLQFITVVETECDPMPAFHALACCPGLQYMLLKAGLGISLSDFPQLNQLRMLNVSKPGLSEEEVKHFRLRLPNCELIVDEHAP